MQMAALTSASTDAELWAAFENNADYDTSGDVSKAALFIQACRFILLRRPSKAGAGGQSGNNLEFAPGEYQSLLRDALAWWNANKTDSSGVSGNVRILTSGGWE